MAGATTWDLHGKPICDDCAFKMYDDIEKECEYCGMPMFDPDTYPEEGELEDEIYDGICVSCANWLRDNMKENDIEFMNLKLKSEVKNEKSKRL
jgi:hypothetical protein